jgi:hypothetical protein
MSSCTDPVTGKLMDDACDNCTGKNLKPSEKRGLSQFLIKQQNARRSRQRLMKSRKLKRTNRRKVNK